MIEVIRQEENFEEKVDTNKQQEEISTATRKEVKKACGLCWGDA